MSKEDIIANLTKDKTVEKICYKITGGDQDTKDLIQDVYIILLEKDSELITSLYEQKALGFYILRIVRNQYHSASSPFFNKYKRFSLSSTELTAANKLTEPNELYR